MRSPATYKHRLRYHPGCANPDSTHAHGPRWPREECLNPDSAKRTMGGKLAEINAAKRLGLEESGSGSAAD